MNQEDTFRLWTQDLWLLAREQEKEVAAEYKDYFQIHFSDIRAIRDETEAILEYLQIIPWCGHVLDWGCGPSLPGIVIRRFRPDLNITLANFDASNQKYDILWKAYNLNKCVVPLKHYSILPFKDKMFDAVISKGTLEHVPMESESLSEVFRVLKHYGLFIATALPSKYSMLELFNRTVHRPHHIRLYTLKDTQKKFLSHGLHPIWNGYRATTPRAALFLQPIFKVLEQLPLIRHTTQQLTVIGMKSEYGIGIEYDFQRHNIRKTIDRLKIS